MTRIQIAVLCTLWFLPPTLPAQEINSRAEEIQAARNKKAKQLAPEDPDRVEKALNYAKDAKLLERFTQGIAGVRVVLGGLVTGGGFALGPEYLRRDLLNGNMLFRVAARGSLRLYQRYEAELQFPHLANDRVFLDMLAVHRNYPQIDYYGPGPDSEKTGRANYRLEDTFYDFDVGIKPAKRLRLGVTGGLLQLNIGPGTNSRVISAERIYSPVQAPGIDRQTDFLRGGVLVQYDFRDNPGGPRSGGFYSARFRYNSDRKRERHSFRQLDVEAQQYIPFFNKRRVIALRAKSSLTYRNPGQTVPFYLQPVLGGSDDLRGYRPFRFYDDNLLVFNAEYRWEIFSGLDMALFADAGKVFRDKRQFNVHNLESAAGFGFRFNVRNSVFLRIDTGFSHEGFQVWFKFNNVF